MTWRKFARSLGVVLVLAGATAQAAEPVVAGDGVAPALESLMAGEFALQAGKYELAASLYERATHLSDDPAVADRATRIALMANDLPLAEHNLEHWLTLAPDSIDALGVALQIDLLDRRVPMAQEHARELIARDGGWRMLLGLLSQPATDGGDSARGALRAAIEDPAFPRDVEAGLAFAGLARRLGETDLARGLAERLEAVHPADARLLVAGATLDREAGADAAAKARLERAQALPLDAETRRSLAGEWVALGFPARAARVLALAPQNDTSYMLRAAWLVQAQDA